MFEMSRQSVFMRVLVVVIHRIIQSPLKIEEDLPELHPFLRQNNGFKGKELTREMIDRNNTHNWNGL
ncbi:MAG: hypothetical protein GXY48_03055 [Methanomicrobiales archaeon]|nr:hypothetical protein [Methanomicrobiales archaeon]